MAWIEAALLRISDGVRPFFLLMPSPFYLERTKASAVSQLVPPAAFLRNTPSHFYFSIPSGYENNLLLSFHSTTGGLRVSINHISQFHLFLRVISHVVMGGLY